MLLGRALSDDLLDNDILLPITNNNEKRSLLLLRPIADEGRNPRVNCLLHHIDGPTGSHHVQDFKQGLQAGFMSPQKSFSSLIRLLSILWARFLGIISHLDYLQE